MLSFAIALSLLGQDLNTDWAQIPTVATLAPDDSLAIGYKNGVTVTLNAEGVDDHFLFGSNPQHIIFSKSGRYMAVDESVPDDPVRLFVFDREYDRIISVVFHKADTFDWGVTGAFLENESGLYVRFSKIDQFADEEAEEEKDYYKFVDIEKSLISEIVYPELAREAKIIIGRPYPSSVEIVLERVDEKQLMNVVRVSDDKILRTMKPSDSLWYQEYQLINNRLLITHSTRGTEFIDVRSGERFLYMRHNSKSRKSVTFFTPDGMYFVQDASWSDDDLAPEFPAGFDLEWKKSEEAVLAAIQLVIKTAKTG